MRQQKNRLDSSRRFFGIFVLWYIVSYCTDHVCGKIAGTFSSTTAGAALNRLSCVCTIVFFLSTIVSTTVRSDAENTGAGSDSCTIGANGIVDHPELVFDLLDLDEPLEPPVPQPELLDPPVVSQVVPPVGCSIAIAKSMIAISLSSSSSEPSPSVWLSAQYASLV